MKSFVEKIDELIEKHSLLKHPFYVKWSEGKLSLDSLNGYSREYFHFVKAVPEFVESIENFTPKTVKEEIVSLKNDEIEHINPWIQFANALGVPQDEIKSYSGLEKTQKAIKELSNLMNSFESGATAMYALEQEVPKVSETKLDGLKKFYNITSNEAQEYFKIHMESDIKHAETWRKILTNVPKEQEEELIKIAEKSLSASSMILDACYETYC